MVFRTCLRGWLLFKHSRVDVAETFSADQLWIRTISGLFQRCSLPENLWTALIQLWTALKTKIFRAKNQRWNSAVSALIFSVTALIQGWTALISSETAMNSADFWRVQNDNFWFILHFFEILGSTSVLRHVIKSFSPICEKKLTTKI